MGSSLRGADPSRGRFSTAFLMPGGKDAEPEPGSPPARGVTATGVCGHETHLAWPGTVPSRSRTSPEPSGRAAAQHSRGSPARIQRGQAPQTPSSPQHSRVPLDQGVDPRLVPTPLSTVLSPGSGRCQPSSPGHRRVDFGRRQPRLFLGATSQVVSRRRQPGFSWPRGKRLIIFFFSFLLF